ncbi:11-S seed storage protein, plant [Cynara cardunculus var. scolymus]|uniref:11-S seed storage protein, plant n=1 Tax=Cynara cardunculus var. scolymus TaxID=59895 RepID=A0A118K110_CYNCS|nr:11-S seed storage protein, plant [Cynara cardunculus var. scolymus]
MGVGKADQIGFEGDAGEYYVWSNSKTPLLSQYKLGAGKLFLRPFGTCTFGLVSPNSREEKVLRIKKGDVIPLPSGVVSWCFNGGHTDAVMVFMGETTKALVPGQFTYFFGAGVLGFLAGFQSEFVGKTFDLDQKQSDTLINSQHGALLVKLENGTKFPEPNEHIKEKLSATIDDPSGDHIILKRGGLINSLTEKNFPTLGEIGLSAKFVRLEGNAMLAPSYVTNGSIQIRYVGKGSGWIRVVGSEGKPALDNRVEEGDLFIVPQYFATAEIADECGMEVFSIITSSNPIFGELAGSNSVWNALSPVVLRSTLNVSEEFEEVFKSKNTKSITIVPPST